VAIPIRLLLANGNNEIDLVAQSIDMSVNRNISAFPTPNNALQRFAVDTNTPSIKIDINGIFTDDEGLNVDSGSTVTLDSEPMRTAINFGALLPTDRNNFDRQGLLGILTTSLINSHWNIQEPNWISSGDIPKGQSNTISLLARVGSNFEEASDDTEELDVNPSILFKSSNNYSGVSTITVTPSRTTVSYILSDVINIGDRLTKSDGTALGVVQSISNNDITFTTSIATSLSTNDEIHVSLRVFNHIGEEVGFADYLIDDPTVDDGDTAKYTLGLTAVNAVEIKQGFTVTINRAPEILERFRNQCIKIIPSYWLENPPASNLMNDSSMSISINPYAPSLSSDITPRVGIRLVFDLNTSYSSSPTILRTARLVASNVPGALGNAANYDAIINLPIKDIDTATNPASAMAEQVKNALTLSGTVANASISGFNPDGDKTLASAFTVTRNGVLVTIEQKYKPDLEIIHPSSLSPDLTDLFSKDLEFHSAGSTPTQSKKSAGDKAQDLIGLVSNANRNTDLLRGIQIPYDSLVNSSGLTGVARNFFITFGQIPTDKKKSESNSTAASESMKDLTLGMSDGGTGDESPDKWYERILKSVGLEEVEAIFGFLVGAAKDALWITLSQNGADGGNSGGIRIIPEKLHVRYDAGNNYYAFDLELLASDYVIGV
tara:strand:- start:812 stop:2800 length:1989 start_codon:yes stop_codon:yes gene_type:complete